MFRYAFLVLSTVFLVSCAQLGSMVQSGSSQNEEISPFANEIAEEEILNQFSDVPFPPDTILDLTKSVVVGAEENWFGQIFFNSNRSSNEVFSYFKDQMPDTGWFLIMEQQGNQIFLVYEKDLRVAIVNIARKRAGSEAILAVGPRAQ